MPEGTLREAVNLSEDWMVLVFLFTLVSLAYTRRVHPARIFRLWNSMWNIRTMRQTIREEPNTPRANLLFNSVFYLQAGLIAYAGIKYFRPDMKLNGVLPYLSLVGILFGIYLLKRIVLRSIAVLSAGDFSLSEYEYSVFLTNRMLGLLLFPLAMAIAYFPTQQAAGIIVGSAAIILLAISYRLIRSLLTAVESGVTPFYILFYICTLEILPSALGIKWLITN
jgi:hypothetical protein